MGMVVQPGTGLDKLLDQLDDFRDVSGEKGDWLRRSARADLMEVRTHLHEVHRNFKRISGQTVSD